MNNLPYVQTKNYENLYNKDIINAYVYFGMYMTFCALLQYFHFVLPYSKNGKYKCINNQYTITNATENETLIAK